MRRAAWAAVWASSGLYSVLLAVLALAYDSAWRAWAAFGCLALFLAMTGRLGRWLDGGPGE